MLGFTLSKMNMLIFVFALFAIMAYFLASLSNVVLSQQAQQLVEKYANIALIKAKSNTICDVTKNENLPYDISIFGSGVGSQSFFYVLKVGKIEGGEDKLNTLIFSIASRRERDKILAAKSFDVNAEIKLYRVKAGFASIEEITDSTASDGETIFDPQAKNPTNSINVIKEVFGGKSFLYIVPCSSRLADCESNLGQVGCLIKAERNAVSQCLPPDDSCSTA